MSLVRPILEYGAACWDPYRECQISALDRVQNKAVNLRIIRQAQIGNLWRSVRREHACVRSTKRIPVRGQGKRYGIGCRRQATQVGSIIIGKSEPENKEHTSGNTPL